MDDNNHRIKWFMKLIQLIVISVILIISTWISWHWISNPPKAKRKKPPRTAPLVTILELKPASETLKIKALGNVKASRIITLTPMVSGKIKWIHDRFIPGEIFAQGDKLLELNASEYQFVLNAKQGELRKAEANLKLEMGRQKAAKNAYSIVSPELKTKDTSLILRKPQQEEALGQIEAVKAQTHQAWLNIKRTIINAPWRGMLMTKTVDAGSAVGLNSNCGTYVGVDVFWIEVQIPRSELKYVILPEQGKSNGSEVEIFDSVTWGKGIKRKGTVVRLLPDLEKDSKLVKVLVEVKDPLDLEKPAPERKPLLLENTVRTVIHGRRLDGIFRIPANALHEGKIWIVGSDGKVQIRQVDPLWKGRDWVILEVGVKSGEKLITTNLSAVVSGMKIRIVDKNSSPETGLKTPEIKPAMKKNRNKK